MREGGGGGEAGFGAERVGAEEMPSLLEEEEEVELKEGAEVTEAVGGKGKSAKMRERRGKEERAQIPKKSTAGSGGGAAFGTAAFPFPFAATEGGRNIGPPGALTGAPPVSAPSNSPPTPADAPVETGLAGAGTGFDSFFGLGSIAASPVNGAPPAKLPPPIFGRFFAGPSSSAAVEVADGGGRSSMMRTGPFAFFVGGAVGVGLLAFDLGCARFRLEAELRGGGRERRDDEVGFEAGGGGGTAGESSESESDP